MALSTAAGLTGGCRVPIHWGRQRALSCPPSDSRTDTRTRPPGLGERPENGDLGVRRRRPSDKARVTGSRGRGSGCTARRHAPPRTARSAILNPELLHDPDLARSEAWVGLRQLTAIGIGGLGRLPGRLSPICPRQVTPRFAPACCWSVSLMMLSKTSGVSCRVMLMAVCWGTPGAHDPIRSEDRARRQ